MDQKLERMVKEYAVTEKYNLYPRRSARIARRVTENLFEGIIVKDSCTSKEHQLYYTKSDTPFQGLYCIKPTLEFLGIHDYDLQMREVAKILDEGEEYHDFTYHRNRYGACLEEDLFSGMSKIERTELFKSQHPKVITFAIELIKYGEGIANYVERPTDPTEKSFEMNGIFGGQSVPEPLKSRLIPLIDSIREPRRKAWEEDYSLSDLAISCLDVTRKIAKKTADYMIEQYKIISFTPPEINPAYYVLPRVLFRKLGG